MPRSGKRDSELLGALLADARAETTDEDIAATTEMFFNAIPGGKLIPIERLREWGDQPRKTFDEAKLAELALSIAASGVLEPLLVRRDPARPGHYAVTAGMRRLLAARRVQGADDAEARRRVETLPCVIRESAEPEAFADALVENLARQDLTRREVMDAVKALKDQYRWSVREIARRTGRNDHDLSELIRVAEDAEVAPLVADEHLAATAAGPLVQARNRAIRGPVIAAIHAGRVRTLAQVEAALDEERERRDHPTDGDGVRDITHPESPQAVDAPPAAADLTLVGTGDSARPTRDGVRDITHLTITERGPTRANVPAGERPGAPQAGAAQVSDANPIPVKAHERRVGASTRAEALARDIITFARERPTLDRAALLKLTEAHAALTALIDAGEGH
jgi:ParB family chromosome partitioning protein